MTPSVATALEQEEAARKKAKAEKPKPETDAEKIARLEGELVAEKARTQQALNMVEAYGKRVTLLGAQMQAQITRT